MTELTPLQRKLAERRAAKEAPKAAEVPFFPAEDVPENPSSYETTADDNAIDALITNIDILDAYRRWIGKMNPNPGSKRESIMISCPRPEHPDKNPSAWVNLDKQLWHCAACDVGGDIYDLAAIKFGAHDYKSGKNFHDLRKLMAEDYGFRVSESAGGVVSLTKVDIEPDEPAPTPAPTPPPALKSVPTSPPKPAPVAEESESATVSIRADLTVVDDEEDEPIELPILDWRKIVPADTFLDIWMQQTTQDDATEEYHFWNGMLALGAAIGRRVTMTDQITVKGNLFLCILGKSGSGKSKSMTHLKNLISQAFPYNPSGATGVNFISAPASAESLIDIFAQSDPNPVDPKAPGLPLRVKGIVDYNELSSLVSRGQRTGNVLMPTLMEFYDAGMSVSTTSRGSGKMVAHEPFCSTVTTTQIKSIKKLVTAADVDSGWLNRWLFVSGQPKNRVAISFLTVDVTPAVRPIQDVAGWAGVERNVFFTKEALGLFVKYDKMMERDQNLDETDILVRLNLLMKKLILLFSANMKEPEISTLAVEQAFQCYEYIKACYMIVSGQVGHTISSEIQGKIERISKKYFEKNQKWPTMNEFNRRIDPQRKQQEALAKTVKTMMQLGLLREKHSKTTQGHEIVRYEYVG